MDKKKDLECANLINTDKIIQLKRENKKLISSCQIYTPINFQASDESWFF